MSERYTVARITRDGEHFEILVKPQPALNYTMGKPTSISEVLVTETIFTDANKGTKAGEEKLQKAFNTTDIQKIAEVILKRGNNRSTKATDCRKAEADNSFHSTSSC